VDDHGFLNSRDNLASKIQSKVLENRSAYSFISTYESRFYPEVEGMDYSSQKEYLTNNVRYPIQLVVETISVSYLSKIYSGLSKDLRVAIAEERFEGWDEFALNKAAARISVLRNAVSHHARVWNKELPHGSRMPYFMWTDLSPVGNREALRNYEAKSTFDMLTIFLDLMPKLEGSYAWNQDAHAFVDLLTPAQLEAMGFPRKWRMVSYWEPLNFDSAS
jgi:abortive infection bacteriophage resistance protein